jgi:hypothetical protein
VVLPHKLGLAVVVLERWSTWRRLSFQVPSLQLLSEPQQQVELEAQSTVTLEITEL